MMLNPLQKSAINGPAAFVLKCAVHAYTSNDGIIMNIAVRSAMSVSAGASNAFSRRRLAWRSGFQSHLWLSNATILFLQSSKHDVAVFSAQNASHYVASACIERFVSSQHA